MELTKKGSLWQLKTRKKEKKGKESTQRNVVVIRQPHFLLLQKAIHLIRKKEKRVVKRGKNIAAKEVHLLQMNQILKQILTPGLSK